jgi:tripartite-type tricarboxylate transporter receptor subunit TctC
MTFRFARRASIVLAALAVAATVHAQSYPNRPIRWVIPFAAGGGSDITARLLQEPLSKELGQQIVVDNKPGAGAVLGADIVAKSKPDGYTILYTTPGPQITNPFLMKELPYDPVKDLVPVAPMADAINILVVHPSVPASSTKELIAYAKANPGKLNFESSGIGSSSHLSGELFKQQAGIEITHVPYKGTGAGIADLVAGNVQMAIDSISSLSPYVKSGQLRALAVATLEPVQAMPGLPTIAETLPGFDGTSINYISVPAGTPKAVADRLNQAFANVIKQPEIQERMTTLGIVPRISSQEVILQRIDGQRAKWKKVIEAAGSTPQ